MNKQIIKTIALSTLASTFLLGANVPTISDVEKQIKTPDIKKDEVKLPEIKSSEFKTPMSDSGQTIFVKDFIITGNKHIKSKDLEQFYKEFKNKDLTFNELQEVAIAITQYYRQKGYFVARAYIPEQNVLENDGVLEIAIIEGNYGSFNLTNKSLIKDKIVQSMLDDAKARDNVISSNTLERAMLIINDTPGATVSSADIKPGVQVGTSDFDIVTDSSKRYDGYAITDNQGSTFTGKYRLMAGLNINSPFKIGDKISTSLLFSNRTSLKNGKVAYAYPLMSNGLRNEISYSQTNYSLVGLDGIADNAYKGNSKTFQTKFTYPIIRTRIENLNSTLTLNNKDLEDELNNSKINPRNVKSLNLGLDYDKNYVAYGYNSSSNANLTFTYGKVRFDNSADELANEAGANTNGSYSKINLDLANSLFISNEITLDTKLKMQYAFSNKNLDGGEDFSIGGSSGVKVYPDGEFSAENGYLVSLETKYRLPQYKSVTSTVGVFYDRGRAYVSNNDNNSITTTNKTLQDIGVAYYSSYKNFFGEVKAAWTLNSEAASSEDKPFNSRITYQVGLSF